LVVLVCCAGSFGLNSAAAQNAETLSVPESSVIVVSVPPGYEIHITPRAPAPPATTPAPRLQLDSGALVLANPYRDTHVLAGLRRRHRMARRAALWIPVGAAVAVAGGVGLALCIRHTNGACGLGAGTVGSGVATMLVGGGLFVIRTNRESRAMRRAGLHVSRVRGILGLVFYAIPYLQPIGLILAARQRHFNRLALEDLERAPGRLRPKYF